MKAFLLLPGSSKTFGICADVFNEIGRRLSAHALAPALARFDPASLPAAGADSSAPAAAAPLIAPALAPRPGPLRPRFPARGRSGFFAFRGRGSDSSRCGRRRGCC